MILLDEPATTRKLCRFPIMASAHQCEHCAAVDKVQFGRCRSQIQPLDLQTCEATPQPGVRSSASKSTADTTSTACSQCHKWLHRRRLEGHIITATQNPEEGSLLQTAEVRNLLHCEGHGCRLCCTILSSVRLQIKIKVEFPEQEPLSDLARCSLRLLTEFPGWTIEVEFGTPLRVLTTGLRLVPCEIESTDRWILEMTEREMCFQQPHESCAYRLNTQRNVVQIKTWLEECKSSHQSYCGRREGRDKEGNTFRLVFLGGGEQPHARLVDVNTLDLKTEYVTLSHRWNSSTKATETTQTNVANAYQSISLDAYPRHFKEVMSLARRLGFSYIWIDSICIIQDPREDWSKQATLMHQIYSNGTLNFALLETFNTHQEPTGQAYANTEVLGCNLSFLDTSEPSREAICWKPENFDYVFGQSHLYSRGWTFQERLLSPRTIHFGKQMYWECCTRRACTTFPRTVDYPGGFADDFVLRFKQLTPNFPQYVAVELHRIWCPLVRDYSRRQFTKTGDRHIALSGVAQRLQHVYSLGDDDYVYGLWKPCLPEQLLWRIEGTRCANLDRSNAGPSWSWVSHTRSAKFVSMFLGTESIRQRLATFIHFYEVGERTPTVNVDATSSSRTSAVLSLKGILIPFDYNTLIAANIEFDYPTYEHRSGTYLLPIMEEMVIIHGLVLQSASIKGDMIHDHCTFRRLGLFQGPQTIIQEILHARHPSIESSSSWATLLRIHSCILNLIS